MNRLLLKECLDELRSDDSVELTEAHNNRRKDKKKRGTRGSVPARHSRHLEPNLEDAPLVPPTPVDPNAEQNLASLAQRLAQGEHLSPVNFLREVCEALGYVEKQVDESGNPKKLNPNHSVYFVNQLNGREFHLRMANHRATVNEFARREEWENNTGIVLKMSDKPLIPDSRVDYIEYVFLPPLLIQEKKQDIVLGIIDWVKTGNYSGPIGDMKPGISRRRKPLKMKKPTFSDTPSSPATPPTGPEVQESLAAKYFKEAHNMKYRLLKEAALQELKEMEENAWGEKLYRFRYFYSPATMRESGALRDEPLSPDGYCIYVWGETEDSARAEAEEKLYKRFGERPIAMYSEEEWEAMETGADCYKKTTPRKESALS